MNIFDIPIFKKAYELYKLFYQCFRNFPRYDRYTLGESCAGAISDLMEYIMAASQLSGKEKLPYIRLASRKINLLRFYFIFSKDIHAIDGPAYSRLNNFLDEIGKMLGGWERFIVGKNKATPV